MIDISGFNTSITIISLLSFPMGFAISALADDTDPIAIEDTETTGYDPLYDGSLFFYDKTSPIKLALTVIPNSDEDINLKILLQMRKSDPSILRQTDATSIILSYPDGGRVILSNGSILSGPLADTIQVNGRKKGNTYKFAFGSFAGAQSFKQLVATVGRFAADVTVSA